MQLTPTFTSVGVNRVVNTLDWGSTGLIAYGGHWIVCIYDPEAAAVVGTLTGHQGQVNCVKWLPQSVCPPGVCLLLSGAADNSIHLWAWYGQQHSPPWRCITEIKAHQSPVTSLAVQELDPNTLLLASTSGDPQLQLWHCNHFAGQQQQQQQHYGDALDSQFGPGSWQQLPPLATGPQIQHCVAIAQLPEDPDWLVLATGGSDSSVRLFVRGPDSGNFPDRSAYAPSSSDSTEFSSTGGDSTLPQVPQAMQDHQVQQPDPQDLRVLQSGMHSGFKLQCQLKGHDNWIRGVAFTAVRELGDDGRERVSLLLATAAQDRYGRIWCMTTDAMRNSTATAPHPHTTTSSSSSSSSSSQADALRQLITRYAPRPHVSTDSNTYWVSLEALLVGHEDWLHTVTWRPAAAAATAAVGVSSAAAAAVGFSSAAAEGPGPSAAPGGSAAAAAAGGTSTASAALGEASPPPAAAAARCGPSTAPTREELVLLSTSQDRSMMLWCFDRPSGLWMSEAAVGDAGASCLGFYGGAFSPDGTWLVAHGFTGALHLWRQQGIAATGSQELNPGPDPRANPNLAFSSSRRDMHWVPQHALGGHYGRVEDLCWGGDGACLQSVGADQTARLFTGCQGHWFELARTQVHGHDFSCLATIPTTIRFHNPSGSSSSSSSSNAACLSNPAVLYVSGSEEKVLRVFEAPQAFADTLSAVRSIQSPITAAAVAAAMSAAAAARGGRSEDGSRGRALGASVSALGLSNKALYFEDQGDSGNQGSVPSTALGFGQEAYNEGPDFVPCATPSVVRDPPLEEHLAQNTLWPEIRKLYGHGNDVFCVCSSPNGRIIASACKAQSAGAAAVWVWEVGSWKAIAQLPGHTLTITQLEFSPNGQLLLSGSRDRSFSIWRVPASYAAAAADDSSAAADTANNAAAAVGGNDDGFELVVRLQKAHGRIIWGVSWSYHSRFFATGSRDQTVKLWAVDSTGMPGHKPAITLPPFAAGVTAVALAPQHVSAAAAAPAGAGDSGHARACAPSHVHFLAVGLENGRIEVWGVTITQGSADTATCDLGFAVEQLWVSKAYCQHASVVKRLRWAPDGVAWLCGGSEGSLYLASCGEDNSVRVFGVTL